MSETVSICRTISAGKALFSNRIKVSAYITLVAVSLSLGFWIGTRARSGTHVVNLSRIRTEPPAGPALLQSRTSNSKTGNETGSILGGLVVSDNSTSLRVNATEDCKMVGRNLSDGSNYGVLVVHAFFMLLQVLVVRTDLGMTSGKIAAQ